MATRRSKLPDVRDGLTDLERTVLLTLSQLQHEHGGRHVKVIELWGRVVEKVNVSQTELQAILKRLGA